MSCKARLAEERKKWRKDHPFGFVAKPRTLPDGTTDMCTWECRVPGQEKTAWAGGVYPVTIHFKEDYPITPPTVKLPPRFFHPNVFDEGDICLSIISKTWKPGISVADILLGVQALLSSPNETDPANWEYNELYVHHRKQYDARVAQEVQKYTPKDE